MGAYFNRAKSNAFLFRLSILITYHFEKKEYIKEGALLPLSKTS